MSCGHWFPATINADQRVHAVELPLAPTLCGLQPDWIAPHMAWPHPWRRLCGTCYALADHADQIALLPEVGR